MTAGASGARSGIAASAYALSARPGFVSSWLSAFAARPTSRAPESLRVASSPSSGMPTSLRTPVVRPLRRCAAKPRSCRRRGRRRARSPRPRRLVARARRRSSRPTAAAARGGLLPAGRTRAERRATGGPVREPAQVAPGRAVAERELDLFDRDAGADGVVRHPRLAAEPGRGREAPPARAADESARCPESGSRSSRPPQAKKLPGGALDDAEAAALLVREDGDREVGVARRSGRRSPGGRRRRAGAARPARSARQSERLALSPARQAEDACTGGFGLGGGPSREPSSATITSASGNCSPESGDGRTDPLLLVACRDEDGELSHVGRPPESAAARRRGRSS